MHSGGDKSAGNVPAFLMKVWTLVEDPATDELIYWDPSGTSFHVFDQQRFSREILPLFFKHSNIASFIRQLNMYGFRKVAHIDQGSLKIENDDLHFQHPYFQRGERDLLQHIKRKVSNQAVRVDSLTAVKNDEVSRVLTDVTHMKSKQEHMDQNLEYIKRENKLLWREVASLRQKHHKQQEIVNKLIQFLVSLVSSNRAGLTIPALRRGPLAIDSQESTAAPMTSGAQDVGQQIISTSTASNYTIESPKSVDLHPIAPGLSKGPIIHELPEVLESPVNLNSLGVTGDMMDRKDFLTSTQLISPSLLLSHKPTVTVQNVTCPESPSASTPIKIPTAPSLQDALNYAWTSANTPLQESPSTTQQDTLLNRRKRTRPLLPNTGDQPAVKKSPAVSETFAGITGGLITPVIESEDQANSTLEQLVMSSSPATFDSRKLVGAGPGATREDVTLALPTFNPGEDISVNNANQLDFLNSDLDGLRGLLQEQYKIDPTVLIDLFDSSNPWSIIAEKNADGELLCDTDDEPGTSCLDSSNGDITGTELVQYNPKELFPELLDDNVIGEIDDLD